ncbi:transposase family protein, partial [Rhodococcus rhodochrous]
AIDVGDLWSWDITTLKGPRTQDQFRLYLAIDVYSRFPVAWRIEYHEDKAKAVEMFTEAFTAFGAPGVLH